MDRKKVMKIAVIGVLLLSFCFLITAPIHADVGNSFSGGGGHSSGGGGGYSHSYGGSGGLSGIFFLRLEFTDRNCCAGLIGFICCI